MGSQQFQDSDLKFERYTLEEGLSQSAVPCILQDSKGFMWFCTQDGLNRYDGYQFVVYEHDPQDPNTLGSNFIQSLYEDGSGTLWIGTNGGGLSRLDRTTAPGPGPGQLTLYQHDPEDPHSLSSNVVRSIYEDRQGVLWIGTDGGGLNRFDRDTGRFERFQNDPQNPHSLSHNEVQTIYEDREGALWIGTDGGGLNRFNRDSGRFERFQHDPQDPDSLADNQVQAILEDRQGALWIATNGGGLDQLDRESPPGPGAGRFIHHQNDPDDPRSLSDDAVWAIYEDRMGMLWIGTLGGGLDRYDRETGHFVHHRHDPGDPQSLSNDHIWSIYEDRAGGLWIGTFGGGVNRLDRETDKFRHYQADPNDPNSLSENVVWSICEDLEGVLWIGTNGGGLNRLVRAAASETGEDQFVYYQNVPTDTHSLSDNVVWSIHQDEDGVLWLGTSAGLDRFARESAQGLGTGHFTHYPADPVFTIHQDREGLLWLGTWGGGLGRFDRETEQLTFYQNDPADIHSLSDDNILSILEDREGVLWVGTLNGGLDRFDRETERFVHYQHDPEAPSSLSDNIVLDIHQDRNGILWIATGGGGLNRLDRETMTFSHYTDKDGLPNDTVYGILEDEVAPDQGGPNLWLSTNRGLSKFNPQDETFRNYDVGDGLQSNEFNQGAYHRSRSGEMFFGGVNGFNVFYPEQVRDNAYVPPIVLTRLTQTGEDVNAGAPVDSLTEVSFKWPRNFFEFEFAALNYVRPQDNQYAYMLEGFDPDWVKAGTNRLGRYTNLPGGRYTLRMKGSNNDGVWNNDGLSVQVTIVPPLWERWWFRGIIALLLLGIGFGAYRFRIRSVEARSRELESQVADRTKELAALNAVTSAVNRSLDLQSILDDALERILQVTETQGGGVYLLDETETVLTIAAHRGFDPEFVSGIDRLQVGEGFSGYVLQSGQPLVVDDISVDERLTRMAARERGLRSMVCVPLSSKGQVLGTLFAASRVSRHFSEQEVQLLTSIGSQIGVALENARLFEATQRRAEQFQLMNKVGRRIISILAVDQLLQEVVTLIQEALGYHRVSIGLIEGDELVFKAAIGPGLDPPWEQHMRLRVGEEGVTGWVASAGEPLVVPDVSKEPRFIPIPGVPPSRSELAVPLRTKDAVIGVLNVESFHLNTFDESDLAVLQSLAHQAAIAIENAQLLEAERQRADELDALRTTMTEITAELELPALLQAIVERSAGLLDATGGEFGLYDQASRELQIVVSYNLGEDYVGTRHRLGEGAMGRVAETGESLIIPDYQNWERGLTQYSHVHATLATPLEVGGRLVGVFTTVSTDPDRQFTQADLHLLNLFAQQAAIAIENARLYEQAQQLAVVEERQRLARDLHDSVTQALYGMTLYSEAAAEELSLKNTEIVGKYLGELQHTAQEALAEMRLLIYELRPSILEEEGLVAALQARLLAVEGRAGLRTEFTVEAKDRLRPTVEEGLYRIAREALNNILKHAQASTITLHLRHAPQEGAVTLEIMDDGIGLDPETIWTKGGLGLSAMEERATALGGQLTVENAPQGGTRVLVEVPA
ncbi:MAG: GAF domain-containing protein [Anaerolineae bacterium]